MIDKILEFSLRQRTFVVLGALALTKVDLAEGERQVAALR